MSKSDDMRVRESPGKDLRVDNALRILQERVTWSRQRHTSGPTPPAPHSTGCLLLLPQPPSCVKVNVTIEITVTSFSRTQLEQKLIQERSGWREKSSKVKSYVSGLCRSCRAVALEYVRYRQINWMCLQKLSSVGQRFTVILRYKRTGQTFLFYWKSASVVFTTKRFKTKYYTLCVCFTLTFGLL